MAKHHKRIVQLAKSEEDNGYKLTNKKKWEDVEKIFTSGEDISEKEYTDILTGKHDHISPWRINSSFSKLLALSHNNNPSTNSKVLSYIKENTADEDDIDFDGAHKFLSQNGKLSSNDIDKYIDGTHIDDRDRSNQIIHNPNLGIKHLETFGQKNPNQIGYVLEHPNYSPSVLKSLFNQESFRDSLDNHTVNTIVLKNMNGYNMNGDPKPDEEQSLNLDPNITRQLLEHGGDKATPAALNVLLDHADPNFKKQWTDEKLGITGGSYGHTFPEDYEDGVEDEEFKEENWGNWASGEGHDSSIARYLAGSRHIDDSQAEHIKRHHDIDDKYKLYENKHIDPKHGVEMFQKWYDDEDHHGYDAQELNEYHKEWKEDHYTQDDLDPSVLEEIEQEGYDNGQIDEAAEEQYSITDYFDDEEDSIVKKIIEGKHASDEALELADEKIREEYDDWTGENPNSSQNYGNPDFQALNKLWEHENDGHLSLEDLKEQTGLDDWSKLGLEPDDDGDVHSDEIKEKLDEFGGPETIDFADHDEFHISEHPDYDERFEGVYEDAVREHFRNNPWEYSDSMYLYEDHRESDGYSEALSEARKNYIEENAKDYMDELWEGSHQDTRFIPHHLHAHIPNFHELHTEQRTRNLDGPHRNFLNQHIKDRSYEHAYGEGQHHHELLKDYADANGGKIDVGTMNKLFPNNKDTWKKIFDGKGKISSEEIQSKIDAIPKTNYDISYGQWNKGQMQNINSQDQVIMRLDHSPESIKPLMEDSSVYDTFKRVQDTSQRSGHPTRNNTIAWARIDTTDPKHWMIDETQSDFGKTVQRYLKKEGADDKASHIDTINEHHKNWRETLVNAVLKEAKKHGVEKVSTHSPESKHAHAAYGADKIHSTYKKGYQKVPRSMGFRSVEHTELPLTDKGRETFAQDSKLEGEIDHHKDAYTHHWTNANLYTQIADNEPNYATTATEFANQHMNLAGQHLDKLKTKGLSEDDMHQPDMNHPNFEDDYNDNIEHLVNQPEIKGHKADKDLGKEFSPEANYHKGHTYDLTPKFLKKNMDDFLEFYEELQKAEGKNAIKAGVLALGLMHGAHYMGQGDSKQQAAANIADKNIPSHARSIANVDHKPDPVEQARLDAKKEADDIIARNDKKWFLNKHGQTLSPHVYKQTIKNNPELNQKYGYTNSLSNRTFKEVIEKNPNLREDVHSAHYDKLHQAFGGDHENMLHAWSNGVKATQAKINKDKSMLSGQGRQPAATEAPKVGEQPSQDTIDDSVGEAPEAPNFTHRRMFRGKR